MRDILEKIIETNLEIIKLLNNINDFDNLPEATEFDNLPEGTEKEKPKGYVKQSVFNIFNETPNIPTKQLSNKFNVSERCIQRYRKEWREASIEDRVLMVTSTHQTYLMKNKRNKLYKIGRSKNPKQREKTLQSEEPSILIVKTWDKDIEGLLHHDYKDFRVRGEWFKLNKIQVKHICTKY